MTKLYLLLVLSVPLILAPPNDNVDVYVVAIANSSSNVYDVTIEVLSQTQPYQEPEAVSGQRLPPECVFGSNSSKQCSAMLDVSNKSLFNETVFMLSPLMNGVLIQRFVHEDSALHSVENHPLLVQLNQPCSPVIMIQTHLVPSGIFLLCKSVGQLSLFKLIVDYSDLSKSSAKFQGDFEVDTVQLSNFVEVTSTETSIVFVSGDRLYQLDLEESYLSSIGDLPSASCMPVSQLVWFSGTLLAYCSDQSVAYFESDGTFLNLTNPLMDGIPLVCPDPDVRLAMFNGGEYIKIGLWSESTYFLINLQTEFYSSVCFGNKTALHFVYTNATGTHGFTINLLESSANFTYTLDANLCQLESCEPLMVFDNRWLLLQVASTPYDSSVMVFDSFNRFDAVLQRLHVNTFALGIVLPLLELPSPTPSKVMTSSATISLTPTPSNIQKHTITIIVVLSVFLTIGLFVLLFALFLAFWCRQQRSRYVMAI